MWFASTTSRGRYAVVSETMLTRGTRRSLQLPPPITDPEVQGPLLPDYDRDEVEAKLNARLKELDTLLGNLEVRGDEQDSELADYDQHPGDQRTETLEQEMDETKRTILQQERSMVEQALQRLEEGTYGYSIDSG